MNVEITYNGRKYFLKVNYAGPESIKFVVLEFNSLEQIEEFRNKLNNAIFVFKTNLLVKNA